MSEVTPEKKVGWSKWYREARQAARTHGHKRVPSEQYRVEFNNGHTVAEAVENISAALASQATGQERDQ